MKIRHKVVVSPIAAALALLLIQVVDYRANSRQETLLSRISQGYFPAVEASRDLRERLAEIQRALQDGVAAAELDRIAEARDLEADFRSLLAKALENPIFAPQERDRLASSADGYFATAFDVSQRMIAGEIGEGIVADLGQMRSGYNEIRQMLESGMEHQKQEIESAFATTIASQRRARMWTLSITLLCVALLVPVAFWVIRSINRPLRGLIAVADRLSAGDLSIDLKENRQDNETAVLENAFRIMAGNLRNMLSNVDTSVRELSANAANISTTAKQSAASAEEQASMVAEVSTSAEEIRQTSKAATESAQEVVRVAEEAVARGQKGLVAIAGTVEAINLIAQRVDGVAGKILELNEKNTQIGEIVETVNDLAEQSNLLAVNASIEAAKAGEQGRGFAVVASEVRNLAAQSKRATQQIRGLLAEIQAASERTVMATEEAAKRTADGRGAVDSVRLVVDELASVLEASADQARQIAGATTQQAAGISQIAGAMDGVSRGSEDTATASRELEQSAVGLGSLADQLRGMMSAYNL